MKHSVSLLLTIIIFGALTSCASIRRDRCYLSETRYLQMKQVFETTGSYQRAAQAMNNWGWAHCEINQFRYRLRKDLELDAPEYDFLFDGNYEPSRNDLDFNPGRVEKVPN